MQMFYLWHLIWFLICLYSYGLVYLFVSVIKTIKIIININHSGQKFMIKVQRIWTLSMARVSYDSTTLLVNTPTVISLYVICTYQLILLKYMVCNTWYCYWVVFLLTSGRNAYLSFSYLFRLLSQWLCIASIMIKLVINCSVNRVHWNHLLQWIE